MTPTESQKFGLEFLSQIIEILPEDHEVTLQLRKDNVKIQVYNPTIEPNTVESILRLVLDKFNEGCIGGYDILTTPVNIQVNLEW